MTNIQVRYVREFFAGICFAVLLTTVPAMASDDPDELYRQGRFAEAEKAYADRDMDRPKDIRFRYNRGCAAYQNSDYATSEAAFSSVLRRAEDKQTRFKAVFNLGNTAFKQGDLSSAANYYKQAILYNPDNSDAMYNLELALREMKKQEENQQKDPHSEGQNQPNSSKNQEGQEEGQKQDTPPDEGPDESQGKDQSENQEQNGSKDQSGSEQEEKPDQQPPEDGRGKDKQQSPQDLSGKLEPREAMPEQNKENENMGLAPSMIDRKKAEALLDNIQEDPSRFLHYQIPQEKRQGVSSGKDW